MHLASIHRWAEVVGARSFLILISGCGQRVSAGLSSFSCVFGSGLSAVVRRVRLVVAGVVECRQQCCATAEAMCVPKASGWVDAGRVGVVGGPGGRGC